MLQYRITANRMDFHRFMQYITSQPKILEHPAYVGLLYRYTEMMQSNCDFVLQQSEFELFQEYWDESHPHHMMVVRPENAR